MSTIMHFVKNCLYVSFNPRTRQWSVISFPGPKLRIYEEKGPSWTHPTKLLGIWTPLAVFRGMYVPGTPSPPNPVTGSKIGESSKLWTKIRHRFHNFWEYEGNVRLWFISVQRPVPIPLFERYKLIIRGRQWTYGCIPLYPHSVRSFSS